MRDPTITIPQDRETEATRDLIPGPLALTYVYARSRDTRLANALGQDFIAYRNDADASRIVFAVCDGVSQSFYGEIAARFLGLRLVDFLWECDSSDGDSLLAALNDALSAWATAATGLVQAKIITPTLPEMHRVALERKRAMGSESMFVAGRIERATGRLILCWMGDMRLRLWDAGGRALEIPGAVWETRERWSSKHGPRNGSARGGILPLEGIAHITAHSDGVGSYGPDFGVLSQDMLDSMVDMLSAAPASDDISVFDIDFNANSTYGEFRPLAEPQIATINSDEPVFTWRHVPMAARYRIAVDDGQQPFSAEIDASLRMDAVPQTAFTYTVPASSTAVTCRVQALNDYCLPSPWSQPVTFAASVSAPRETSPTEPHARSAGNTSRHKSARKKKSRKRGASCLILALSILLLIGVIVIGWLALVIVKWNELTPT